MKVDYNDCLRFVEEVLGETLLPDEKARLEALCNEQAVFVGGRNTGRQHVLNCYNKYLDYINSQINVVKFDRKTDEWFKEHPETQTTVMMCEKCGVFYKPELGHACDCAKFNKTVACKTCMYEKLCEYYREHLCNTCFSTSILAKAAQDKCRFYQNKALFKK